MNALVLLCIVWFVVGAAGLCVRPERVSSLLCVGLMGQAIVVLAFVFGRSHGNTGGRNLALAALLVIAASQFERRSAEPEARLLDRSAKRPNG